MVCASRPRSIIRRFRVRDMDWSAVDYDTYDCDRDQDGFTTCPVGHGSTEQEATADLLSKIEDAAA